MIITEIPERDQQKHKELLEMLREAQERESEARKAAVIARDKLRKHEKDVIWRLGIGECAQPDDKWKVMVSGYPVPRNSVFD